MESDNFTVCPHCGRAYYVDDYVPKADLRKLVERIREYEDMCEGVESNAYQACRIWIETELLGG